LGGVMNKTIRVSGVIAAISICVVVVLAVFRYSLKANNFYSPEPVYSPDGTRVVIPTVNFDKENYAAYQLIHIQVQDTASLEVLFQVQTRASNRMRWSIAWIGKDVIRLDSSDIGAYCWQEINGVWQDHECPAD